MEAPVEEALSGLPLHARVPMGSAAGQQRRELVAAYLPEWSEQLLCGCANQERVECRQGRWGECVERCAAFIEGPLTIEAHEQ